jgi:hypothetical protein
LPGGPGIDFDALDNAYVTDFTVDSLYVYSDNHDHIAAFLVGDGPLSVALYDPALTSLSGQNLAKLNTFKLFQNYPNPFNPETIIPFEISSRQMVKLEIFNALGQPVRTLINQVKSAGSYQAKWNGEKKEGIRVSSGIYFYRLQVGHLTKTKTMQVLR